MCILSGVKETQQKVWKDGRCYVKYTYYVGTPKPGDGPKELHIEWKEIPLRIDPISSGNPNKRAYIGQYASYYWEDTGELVTPQNEREREGRIREYYQTIKVD